MGAADISPAIKTVSIDASDTLMQCSPNSADSDWTDGSGNVNDYEIYIAAENVQWSSTGAFRSESAL